MTIKIYKYETRRGDVSTGASLRNETGNVENHLVDSRHIKTFTRDVSSVKCVRMQNANMVSYFQTCFYTVKLTLCNLNTGKSSSLLKKEKSGEKLTLEVQTAYSVHVSAVPE